MGESMSSNQRWRLHVKNLETSLRIGIYPHEKQAPQRVLVSAVVEAEYPLKPQSIEECVNYDMIYRLVVEEWPARAHIDLLETFVIELLEYIFRENSGVAYAKVRLDKPDIFKEAEAVGVEAEWTREEFNQRFG
jgi:7,8-dihydroneopterin aldolase/epimerase/oxygenase